MKYFPKSTSLHKENQISKYSFVPVMFIFIIVACDSNKSGSDNIEPPVAEKIKKELIMHGHTRIDNYYWLKERENPKVISYLEEENKYTDTILAHTKIFQQKIFDEIVGRIKQTDETVPYKKSGYLFYKRFEEGKQYEIYCRKEEKPDAKEEILLNVNIMAEGYSFYNVAGYSLSRNKNIIAFGVDTISRRKYTICFKNLTTGELLSDQIPNTTGYTVWANDNKTVFYTTKDSVTLRPDRVFMHILGTDVSTDKEIFYENDEAFYTYIYKTKSEKYLVICSGSTLSTEYRFLEADNPQGEFQIFQAREKNLEYSIGHYEDWFYIRTNLDATNFRLMKTPVNKPGKENWIEVISHREDVLLEDFELFADFMVIKERRNGLSELRIINQKSKEEHYLNFGEEAYTAWLSSNYEFNTSVLRYRYSSLTTPVSTFDYNMQGRIKTLLKQQEVLGNFNPEDYETKRLYAKSADETKIPISLVYRKGIALDGNNPLLLYAYGSYGNNTEPYFNSANLSLLDRGIIYAIAHVRGGQELGRQWYEDGKLLKKKNSFIDFNYCAIHLITEKYTNPQKLFAEGGSAGGLLIGAIINMKPRLYKGVIASVPFVDVITTMLDKSIPLTTGEFDEWGNPENKEFYDYMLSYSPYDNVEAKQYPAILVTTGLYDSQVQYWEPAKWVAKLRDMKTDNNLLLLHTNMESGHGGASGRFERHRETALVFAFIFDQLGITE
jgi:oligopeptidase B